MQKLNLNEVTIKNQSLCIWLNRVTILSNISRYMKENSILTLCILTKALLHKVELSLC